MKEASLSFVHRMLPPREKSATAPPLLLMLHGYGSHEGDLFGLADQLNQRAHVVSLRAPRNLPWGGHAWYDINFDNLGNGKISNVEQARESLALLQEFIPQAQEAYQTDPDQIWLMGFSQGTILCYALALNHPQQYQRVIALSGYILSDLVPQRYQPATLQHLNFFISHGTQDPVLPVDWARQSVKMLEKLGVRHQYREYPIGHGISPEAFADLKKWMEQD